MAKEIQQFNTGSGRPHPEQEPQQIDISTSVLEDKVVIIHIGDVIAIPFDADGIDKYIEILMNAAIELRNRQGTLEEVAYRFSNYGVPGAVDPIVVDDVISCNDPIIMEFARPMKQMVFGREAARQFANDLIACVDWRDTDGAHEGREK